MLISKQLPRLIFVRLLEGRQHWKTSWCIQQGWKSLSHPTSGTFLDPLYSYFCAFGLPSIIQSISFQFLKWYVAKVVWNGCKIDFVLLQPFLCWPGCMFELYLTGQSLYGQVFTSWKKQSDYGLKLCCLRAQQMAVRWCWDLNYSLLIISPKL